MSEQQGKDTFIGERHGSLLTQAAVEKALRRANMQVFSIEEDVNGRLCRSAQNLESGEVEAVLRNAEEQYKEQHACVANMRRIWKVCATDLDDEAARRDKDPAGLIRCFNIYDVRSVFPNDELCAAYHAAALTFNAGLNNIDPALPPLAKRTEKLTSVGDECHVYVGPTPAFAAVSDDSAKCPSATYLFRSGPVFVKMHVSDGTLVVDPTPRQKELAIDPKGPGVNREWQGAARR